MGTTACGGKGSKWRLANWRRRLQTTTRQGVIPPPPPWAKAKEGGVRTGSSNVHVT